MTCDNSGKHLTKHMAETSKHARLRYDIFVPKNLLRLASLVIFRGENGKKNNLRKRKQGIRKGGDEISDAEGGVDLK